MKGRKREEKRGKREEGERRKGTEEPTLPIKKLPTILPLQRHTLRQLTHQLHNLRYVVVVFRVPRAGSGVEEVVAACYEFEYLWVGGLAALAGWTVWDGMGWEMDGEGGRGKGDKGGTGAGVNTGYPRRKRQSNTRIESHKNATLKSYNALLKIPPAT
jgi:hypothetical protein